MSKMTPKITIEKSKGRHIETLMTSEWSKILTFRKKRWQLIDGIFQIRSTYFFDPEAPPVALTLTINDDNMKIQNLSDEKDACRGETNIIQVFDSLFTLAYV